MTQPTVYDLLDLEDPTPGPDVAPTPTHGRVSTLIASRACSAVCLTATTRVQACECPCGGAFHGAVAGLWVHARGHATG